MAKFKDFIKQNKSKNEDIVNEDIIFKWRDEPLAEYIVDAFRTLESRHLKIIDWELITNENEIDTDTVNIKHIKNKDNKKYLKRMPIERSRYDLLKIKFHLRAKDGEEDFILPLLLFKRVRKYYYVIDGNNFYPIYQLVDASTYNMKEYLTLKTMLLPIVLKREHKKIYTIDGEVFQVPYYTSCIFKNKLNPLLFYLATMGYENTMTYMSMEDIIKIESFRKYNEKEEYCFPSEGGLFIKVIRYFFDNDLFVRNMVYNLINITHDCGTIYELQDLNYWVCKLGKMMLPNADDPVTIFKKGKNIIFSFARLLDRTTRRDLRLSKYNKRSIYAVMRWMMRNFSELKAKDNMDLKNKRIRMAEYMEAYLIKRLSSRMNKFMSNNDVTLEDVETLIKMDQDYLIKTVIGSKKPLLRYDNTVNDMDLFTSLKMTIKGPGALGEKNANSVNDHNRGIHLSYVGNIDINTSSNSDPGMSSILTPFAKMYGKFFTDEDEPQSWDKNFQNLYRNYFNGEERKIKSLNYFYKKEKKSRKILKELENVQYFVNEDPYNIDGYIALDVTKSKVRKLYVSKKGKLKKFDKNIKKPNKKKNKKKKSSKKNNIRKVKIKRINNKE